jgi:hypothetical protein
MTCEGDEDSLHCDMDFGRFRNIVGEPEGFDFADDLSRASVRLGPHEAEWVAENPREKPFDFVPGDSGREEGCPEGSGSGRGVYRRMRARGSVFGRALDYEDERSFVLVNRYVLVTECDPAGWWGH